MLTVPTYLDRSPVHGIGLFSRDKVPAGRTVWTFNPTVDLRFSLEEWDSLRGSLSPQSFTNLLTYSYKEKGHIYLCLDDARFMNHSTGGNVGQDGLEDRMFAVREIAAGEELLCNYLEFSDGDDFHLRNLGRS